MESSREDPQTRLAGPVEGSEGAQTPEVRVGLPTPSPEELNAQFTDTSEGVAVSAQPTDEDAADLEEARERTSWDEDTDGA